MAKSEVEKINGRTVCDTTARDAAAKNADAIAAMQGNNSQNAALTAAQINALDGMFKACVYDDSKDVSAAYTAFKIAFGITESGDGAHTHSYTSRVTTAATCTTAGVRTYTCSCGNSYTEAIPATGHNYVDGVCTVCGAADPTYTPDVTVKMIDNTDNKNVGGNGIYSDDGTTTYDGLTAGKRLSYVSEDTFDKDTAVTIKMKFNANNTALRHWAACVTDDTVGTLYYTEEIGYAHKDEYTAVYTVKSGYRLCIINFNSTRFESLVVTKREEE